MCNVFFFFKQKTAYEMRMSDWSSDLCSSDLVDVEQLVAAGLRDERGDAPGGVGMEAGDQAGVVDAPRARGPAFDLEHGEGAGGRIAQEGLDRRAVGTADDLVRVVDALGDDLHRARRDDVGEAAGDRVVDEAAVEREPVVFRI